MNEKLLIELNLDNDVFKPYPHSEVARILSLYAKRVSEGLSLNINFMDINGNTTGFAAYMRRKEKK